MEAIKVALKLMYITNNVEVAKIAESIGVDRIFVDMEYIGKDLRQGGMDTVQSRHTIADIEKIRSNITKSELMVRCNPIHDATDEYSSSEEEINSIINAGADVIMLPYFKTVAEVKRFIEFVNGRAKTILLVETPEAVEYIEEILSIDGIDEVFIGLNDLSLGYGKHFMFELLADGTVEKLCKIFQKKNIPYGFGGIASLGKGLLPAEHIIAEHYRLGSSCVILSRSFCNLSVVKELDEVDSIFREGIRNIRNYERYCSLQEEEFLNDNKMLLGEKVKKICKEE